MSGFKASKKTREKLLVAAKLSPWGGGGRRGSRSAKSKGEANFGSCPFIPAPAEVPEDLMPKGSLE